MKSTHPAIAASTDDAFDSEELALSLPTQSDPPAHDVEGRPARRSAALSTVPWRERVRSRVGTEDVLTFHVGSERFATSLAAIEEAVEQPDVYRVPEMPETMLGVFSLRGRLIPVCSPVRALGVALGGSGATVLLLRAGTRRVGVAVDDVDDVISLDLATVRAAPGVDDSDGVLLGVVRQGNNLIAIVDPDAIVAACLTGQAVEPAP